MRNKLLLEEEINKFKKLSGMLKEAAPGPQAWISSLISKIAKKSLSDDVVMAFEPLINSGKIAIDRSARVIKSIDWKSLTDDEVELLFRSNEMVDIMEEVIKANNISTSKIAMQNYSGNFKKIMDGYVTGKAQPRITGNSTGTNTKTGNLNLGNLSGDIINRSDFIKYVEANPKFSAVLKAKGNKDQLEKWIELNLPETLEKSKIIDAITPYVQDLIDSPNVQKAAFGKTLNSIFDFIKKGKEFPDLLKGAFGWSLLATTALVILNIITPADALRFYLCPFIPDGKLSDFVGCSGGSGSSDSSGGSRKPKLN